MRTVRWAVGLILLLTTFAYAQGTGLFIRTDCTTITSPVTSKTWCLDTTANALKYYNGATYTSVSVSVPISVANGGTNITSYAIGDLIYASGATTLSKLADVAAGSYLRSGGVATAPVWSTATLPNTATTGDLLYASATSVYSNLADVAAGSYLRSGGVTTAPVWSTLILPNAATANRVVYASATNTFGESANLTFDGTTLTVTGNSSLGTVTAATYNGTAIGTQYGGTGGNFSATAQGNTWYFSAAGVVSALAPGTSGQFLKTQGAGANPLWASVSSGLTFVLTPEGAAFPTTNFPQLVKNSDTNWTSYTLDFDQTTSECAFWYREVPNGTTVTSANVEVFSRQASVTSGTVGWTVVTLTRADGEAWDTAGNSDTVTASTVKGTAGLILVQTKALTTTGWAADEALLIKICRDIADTAAEDAKFIEAVVRIN